MFSDAALSKKDGSCEEAVIESNVHDSRVLFSFLFSLLLELRNKFLARQNSEVKQSERHCSGRTRGGLKLCDVVFSLI